MADAYSYLTGSQGDAYSRLYGTTGDTWARLPGSLGDAWERLVASVGPVPVVGDMLSILIAEATWRTLPSRGACYCDIQEDSIITQVSVNC